MKPTEEQIGKFWGYFGIYYSKGWWICPKAVVLKNRPPITLNSLFKWAVPKAIGELIMTGIGTRASWEKLFVWWLDFYFQGMKIEDALFWAISKVIDGNNTPAEH